VGSLLTSQLSREILADVLNAAANVLRQNRMMSQPAPEVGRAVDRGTELASTAVQVGTEAASGAVDTGVEITAAAVDIAQRAAGTLATIATNAALNMLPGAGTGDEGQEDKRRRRARKGRTNTEEES
jgi:hypothetical protein